MDTITSHRTQARRSNTKRSRRPDPVDQIVSDARKRYILHALQVMIRRRNNNEFSFLFDDDEGHTLGVAMCALGLKERDSVVPWLWHMPKPEREAFELRVAQFEATPRNIAAAARFTKADREKFAKAERKDGNKIKRPMQALLQLPMIDADLDEVRRDERNAARLARRQDAAAAAEQTRIKRRRQHDREYRRAKRLAEGVKPLEQSFSRTSPWEAAGFRCRRTWERHGKPAVSPQLSQIRRQRNVANPSAPWSLPKPLGFRWFRPILDGPEPKVSKNRPRAISTDARGEAVKAPCNAEVLTRAGATPAVEPAKAVKTSLDGRWRGQVELEGTVDHLRREVEYQEVGIIDLQRSKSR